jgi:hypothetical protein
MMKPVVLKPGYYEKSSACSGGIMKRISTMLIAAMLLSACAAHAQNPNPISMSLKNSWVNIRDLLTKMADKMPAEDYRFKPTPEVEDFGQRMDHIITSNMGACGLLRGDGKNMQPMASPSKTDIVARMKEANAECDAFFNSLTDADLVKPINMGRGAPAPEFPVIDRFIVQHSQELYGYMAVYLRLKGIVPPSSEQNER